MKQTVTVKDVAIGEGIPKICVPLLGKNKEELLKEIEIVKGKNADLIEWRVDFLEDISEGHVEELLKEIYHAVPRLPLIFTFRTTREGGNKEITEKAYKSLNERAIHSGMVDLIDIELETGEETRGELIRVAQENNIHVIVSNHDFHQTPGKEEIIARLQKASDIGGDIPKIAVMPNNPRDVLTLLDATWTYKEEVGDRPIITMSMAANGMISRMGGEIFGSAVTFASAKEASAPGQIPVEKMRGILRAIHHGFEV